MILHKERADFLELAGCRVKSLQQPASAQNDRCG